MVCIDTHLNTKIFIKQSEKHGGKMGYILGIDQGGTKTAAAVMDEAGKILGTATRRGAYYPTDGMASAFTKIKEAVEEAIAQAGITREQIGTAIAGITGIDWQGDEEKVTEELKKILEIYDLHAYNDAVIALYCVEEGEGDMVLCAGTGMNAAVRDGEESYFVFGDYIEESMQGGSALARRSIRRVFDAQIGLGPDTKLTELFLQFSGEISVNGLLQRYMMEPGFSGEIRFLVPDILKTAQEGDPVAKVLVEEYAGRMAEYICVGLERVPRQKKKKTAVLAGSVFKGEENLLTSQVIRQVKAKKENVDVILADCDPVIGACRMGRERKNGKEADNK